MFICDVLFATWPVARPEHCTPPAHTAHTVWCCLCEIPCGCRCTDPLLLQTPAPAKKKQRVEVNGGATPAAEGGSTTIFVGNLPWSATEDDIAGLFADCGEVTGVRIGESIMRVASRLLKVAGTQQCGTSP
jgi:hypothetical protein